MTPVTTSTPEPSSASNARDWSVAIIAAREDVVTVSSVIDAAVAAVGRRPAVMDLMINGNRDLSQSMASYIRSKAGLDTASLTIRVWDLPLRDKAHAWNEYVHKIWPGSELAFFIDGNVTVMPDAFMLMEAGMKAAPGALAVNAMPSTQSSAHGFGGNLHALSGVAMAELRRRAIRMPLGIYRGDGLLGAILSFRFDPAQTRWDATSITVVHGTTWKFRVGPRSRIAELRIGFNRLKRQARGNYESRAFRDHLAVRRNSPQSLPETVRELVVTWVRNHPVEAAGLALRHPLSLAALRDVWRRQDWSLKDVPPVLVVTEPPVLATSVSA